MVKLELLPEESVGEPSDVRAVVGVVPEVISDVKEEDVKEEEAECSEIGPAMREILATLLTGSEQIGVVLGASTRPHGNIPSLLGFLEEENQQVLGLTMYDVFVPYLGEAGHEDSQSIRKVWPVEYPGRVVHAPGRRRRLTHG